jgi:hypothetical protein
MPLTWDEVRARYASGARIPTGGGNGVEVTRVDNDQLHIRSRLWSDTLQREHLERAVLLVEDGTLPVRAVPDAANPRSFAEGYRHHVTDVRGSIVAHILRDLGHLQ